MAVNKKTKEILSMKVTKEHVHDGKNLTYTVGEMSNGEC